MKTTDWYTRLLLSASALLLLVIAIELHLANRLQAAAISTAQLAAAPPGTAFGPVATSWGRPAGTTVPSEMRVRIVGVEYDGKSMNFGPPGSYTNSTRNVQGLPVVTIPK